MATETTETSWMQTLTRLGFDSDETAPLREARRAFERTYIRAILEQHNWRIAEAARALGLQRPNLYRKARQLSIPLRRPQDCA